MTRQATGTDVSRLAAALPFGVAKVIASRLPRHTFVLERQNLQRETAIIAYTVGPLDVWFRLALTGDRHVVAFDVKARSRRGVGRLGRALSLESSWRTVYSTRLEPDAGERELHAALAYAASKLKWGNDMTSKMLAA